MEEAKLDAANAAPQEEKKVSKSIEILKVLGGIERRTNC